MRQPSSGSQKTSTPKLSIPTPPKGMPSAANAPGAAAGASTTRKHQRVELFAQVLCRQGDVVRILHVYNASQGGLLVEAVKEDATAFSVGDELEFDIFTDEDSTDEPIRLQARVVRTDPDRENKMVRIGAEILSYTGSSKDRFIEMLRRCRGG